MSRTSLESIAVAIAHGQMALVGESAGYLILGAADRSLRQPMLTDLAAISLDEDGDVHVEGELADEERVERSLRATLARLLTYCRSAHPNLQRVASRNEIRGLDSLVGELEAALVPVNRKAARRSLSRLYREVSRFARLNPGLVAQRLEHEVESVLHQPVMTPAAQFAAVAPQSPVSEPLTTAATEPAQMPAPPAASEPQAAAWEPEVSAGAELNPWETGAKTAAQFVEFTREEPELGQPTRESFQPTSQPLEAESNYAEEEIEVIFEDDFEEAQVGELQAAPAELAAPQPSPAELPPEPQELKATSVEPSQLAAPQSSSAALPSEPAHEPVIESEASQQAAQVQATKLKRASVGAFRWASSPPIANEVPLIEASPTSGREERGITELLQAAPAPKASSQLMKSLRTFAEVDHSPAPPQVK